MINRLFEMLLATFERRYAYDMSYARLILMTRISAFLRFTALTRMSSYYDGVPKSAWYAAKIAATVHEDCGPCTQLVVRMAEESKVIPSVLRAILNRDFDNLDAEVALALRYAEAVLARAPEAADLRERVHSRWGNRGLVCLAFAIASSRIFPTLKYALGFAHQCTLLEVEGVATRARRPPSSVVEAARG